MTAQQSGDGRDGGWRSRSLPVGVAAAAAAVAWIGIGARHLPVGLVAGAAALGAAGLPRDRRMALLVAVAGAAVLAVEGPGQPRWVAPAIALAAWWAAPAAAAVERTAAGAAVVPGLFAVTFAGAYACLPETEQVLRATLVVAAVALVTAIVPIVRVGQVGAATLVGLLVACAAVGGTARPSSIIGALAGLGALAIAAWWIARTPTADAAFVALAAETLCVAVTSRVAGIAHSTRLAAVVALAALAAMGVALLVVGRWWPPDERRMARRRNLAASADMP